MEALHITTTGMLAMEHSVKTIANNLANSSTTGYRKKRVNFVELVPISRRDAGTPTSTAGNILPSGLQIGMGVKIASVYSTQQQGATIITDNPFDVMIDGPGFFQVQTPDGTAYTRAGNLHLNHERQIVNHEGLIIEPGITLPQNYERVTINAQGEVVVTIAGQINSTVLGVIELAKFANPGGLISVGNNLLLPSDASGPPEVQTPGTQGAGTLMQYALESSNVNPVSEITELITAQRTYELMSKVITTSDEMLRTLNRGA